MCCVPVVGEVCCQPLNLSLVEGQQLLSVLSRVERSKLSPTQTKINVTFQNNLACKAFNAIEKGPKDLKQLHTVLNIMSHTDPA